MYKLPSPYAVFWAIQTGVYDPWLFPGSHEYTKLSVEHHGESVWANNPPPVPLGPVAFLVAAVSSKEAAAAMTNEDAKQQTIEGIEQAIAAFIDSDDICPPWPWPGPPPGMGIIASELTLIANTLQEGSLRTGLLNVAGQVLDRAALNPQPLPPSDTSPAS